MNWLARLKKTDQTGVSSHPGVLENLLKPAIAAVNDPASLELENLIKPAMPVAANDPAQVFELVASDLVAPFVTGQTAVRKKLVRSEVRTETAVSSSKVPHWFPAQRR